MNTSTTRLYETDFYGWIQSQAESMRSGDLAGLDMENLIEEIESMGKSQQRALESRLEVLLAHLLKWQFQPTLQGPSWRFTIEEQRARIARLLEKNPSLKRHVPEAFEEAYGFAVRMAARETGMGSGSFPSRCPWTFGQATDPDFWPEDL